MSRDLFIHIGAGKSGTSSLQVGLRSSEAALAGQGLGLPYASRRDRSSRILRPLGWEVVEGFPHPVDDRELQRTVQGIADFPGDRLLITAEDLAELDETRVDALVGRLEQVPGLRVHVVITIRDWSRTLPSDWQQQLKRRMTTDYVTYLTQVRDDTGPDAAVFRMRQDLASICSRWAARVPPERIHVVPVGTPQQDTDSIFRDIADVVGIDHESIARPTKSVNRSYGFLECEVLRRLNDSLGPRLGDIRKEYNPGVRRILAKGALDRSGHQRVTLPPEHLGWVQEEMRRQVRAVRELGVHEQSDLDLLVPNSDSAKPLPEIDDAELARVAIDTLAGFAAKSFKQRRDLNRELKATRRRATRAARRVSRLEGRVSRLPPQQREASRARRRDLVPRAKGLVRRAARRARVGVSG
jgi:hypothetical protein